MNPSQHAKKLSTCRRCGVQISWSCNRTTNRPAAIEPAPIYPGDDRWRLHECPCDDVSPTTCRYCGSTSVFWVKRDSKFELTEAYGLPHACEQFTQYKVNYRAALRDDYAFEKKWVNSFLDNAVCMRCLGTGYRIRHGRDGGPPKRGLGCVPCKRCRHIGKFTADAKKFYLCSLRKKYWPWKPWMKWSKAAP